MANWPDEVRIDAEQLLLECNFPKLERLVKRSRRLASPAMLHLLLAEAEFQQRFLNISDDLVSEDEELATSSLVPSSLHRAIHEIEKGLKDAQPEDLPFLRCMLAKLLVFTGRYEEALNQAFSHLAETDLFRSLTLALSSDEGETDEGTSTLPIQKTTLFNTILALQTRYCHGLALEMCGRVSDALLPYAEISDFCRRFHQQDLLRMRGCAYYVALGVYRYGMLCSQLALDPRPLQRAQGERPPIWLLKSRLLYDAAIGLRTYLTFTPRAFGRNRHMAALARYMEVLEGRFRRGDYKAAFDAEGYPPASPPPSPSPMSILASPIGGGGGAGRIDAIPTCAQNMAEDLLLCTQILESLQVVLPSTKVEAQRVANSQRVRLAIARLARIGDCDGLVKYIKGLYYHGLAESSVYGRLLLALAAAGQFEEALCAGEIYISIGGKEESVMLVFARICLLFDSKAQFALSLLSTHMERVEGEMKASFLLMMGLAALRTAIISGKSWQQMGELRERALQCFKTAVQLDQADPKAHFYLSLAQAELRLLNEAEQSITKSLSINVNQPLAWYLFALIKSAQKNYDDCLTLCGNFMENAIIPDIHLSLFKSTLLAYLGEYEEAFTILRFLISTLTKPLGPTDGTIVSPSAMLMPGENRSSTNLTTSQQFRAKFFDEYAADSRPDISSETTMEQTPAQKYGMTLVEVEKCTPEPPLRVLAKKLRPDKPFPESTIPGRDIVSACRIRSINPLNGRQEGLLAERLWRALCHLYLQQTLLHDAQLACDEAFASNEISADNLHLQGLILEKQGRTEQAFEKFQGGLAIDDRHSGCLLGLARYFLRKDTIHSLQVASNYVERAVHCNGENIEALTFAAFCAQQLNLPEKTKDYYDRALQLEATSPLLPFRTVTFAILA